jgi:hypothetical protein
MKRTPRRILLVIAILTFVFLAPGYTRYPSLTEIVFFLADINYENPDQDDQFDGQQHELDLLHSGISPGLFPPQHDLMEQIFHCRSHAPSRGQDSHVLRC